MHMRFGGGGCGAVARKCASLALAASFALTATDGVAEQEAIEEVVVTAKTGSRIGRQGDSPSPLSNYDGSSLREAGLRDLRDLVGVLAINAGAENNADNLTQNFTVGTANVNLRGLGVASTLVLLNSRRQVLSAVQTDDGSSFVDLAALVPVMAIERVEILKDGATAIYGSDAVAGVANFITRQGFEGIEVQAEYRGRTGNGSQDDITLDGVVGGKIAGNAKVVSTRSLSGSQSAVLLTATARHVGPYEDDPGGAIDSFTTLDANIHWSLGELIRDGLETSITLGVANLFDEDPPLVDIAGSYDPRSADPRGRRVFLSVGLEL